MKDEVRREIAAERAARYAVQAAARAKADAEFLSQQAPEKAANEADQRAVEEPKEFMRKCKKAGVAGLIIIGGAVVCYGVYKTTPKVKKWWKERKGKVLKRTVVTLHKEGELEMKCANCGNTDENTLWDEEDTVYCSKCCHRTLKETGEDDLVECPYCHRMRDRKAMYCRWCNDATWQASTQDEFEETDKILKDMGL